MLQPILYTYSAKLIRVIDGDSIVVEIDRGWKDFSVKDLRLARIDTPEIRGAKDKGKGLKAKAWVEKTLTSHPQITVQSLQLDKFGRSVAELWYWEKDKWVNLNDKLLELNLAVAYEG